MRKKVLCIALALLMCLMVTVPAIAENSVETPLNRADITASFGLKHVSGSTYKMWARIVNPMEVTVSVTLTLYNASYSPVASVSTTASYPTIGLNKNVSLSSGTYHLRLSYTADGVTYSYERTYNL